MEIEFLQKLLEYPARWPEKDGYKADILPSTMDEILQLEIDYNDGNQFPKTLRELLYLAGEHCYCLEFNAVDPDNNIPTQTYMQQAIRDYDVPDTALNSTTRPFYIIDSVYSGNFRFIYLDEGDDPIVYNIYERDGSIDTFGKTLSQLIWHVIRHTHKLF